MSRIAGSRQMVLVSAFSYSRISRQASAIDNATPLGLQAPGLMITSASRKRLPWGRFGSDMRKSPLRSGIAPNGRSPTNCYTSSWYNFENLLESSESYEVSGDLVFVLVM